MPSNNFSFAAQRKRNRKTISTGKWVTAALERLESSRDFPYNGFWNGKWYKTKRVRPIFVEEKDAIVVITVYAYYIP